ncbi:flagellar filament capping protein FliD [uncultured Pseudokineococcus sp.]|uniref:flagellar filament capping protein FliD n=1 Tax=uncultured Pseudokineococcus sp. TaxID=1642928 RepID=UPI002615E8AD|nr:flagellar filament capping protein FliD [uncultured Pseudokineococcus sp.]
MAGGLSIGGLSSGLDTKSIVSALMAVESASQTKLKQQLSAAEKQVSAFQSINTRLSSIATMAAKVLPTTTAGTPAPGAAWTATTARSSSPDVTATGIASADSRPGSVSFSVNHLAAAHSVVTGADVAADATVVDGPPYEVAIEFPSKGTDAVRLLVGGNGTVSDVAAAINGDSSLGMRATVLQVSPGQYRLQVSSTTTGEAGRFELSGVDPALGEEVVLAEGRDAQIDLGGGFVLSSATGTFDGLLPGATITPTKATGELVTVSVERDRSSAATATKSLVDSVNIALQEMRSQSAATPGSGGSASTTGPLAGDSVVRSTVQNLMSAVTASGVSPSEAGIELSRDGTLSFDQAKFDALAASDPQRAESIVTGLAERLAAVAKQASDPTTGSVTTAITGRRGTASDLTEQISRWDDRLALRQATLDRQFAALETALSGLNSQGGYLASQIAGLPSWS